MDTSFSEFTALLLKELAEDNNYNNKCLISGEDLHEQVVELPCNHKYNYYPLYREVIIQRKTNRMPKPKIQCPYCRTNHNYVLPYIKMPGVEKINWVNYPIKYQLLPKKCTYQFKNSNGVVCNKACLNNMCPYHSKLSKNNNLSADTIKSITSLTELQSYTVSALRRIAKFHKIKRYSSLKKADLIDLIHKSII